MAYRCRLQLSWRWSPVWIDPLFNDYQTMKNPKLEAALLDLAAHTRIPGSRVFEVKKSVDTNALNAYVTGLFGTKRIVLWDTLLAKLNDREVLAVMGHEMGHYVLNHIPKSVVMGAFGVLASLFWVDRGSSVDCAVSRPVRIRFAGRRRGDSPAPRIDGRVVTGARANRVGVKPVSRTRSRPLRARPDPREPLGRAAFVTLQRENLSVPRLHWLETIFRSSHPSIAARIEFCNSYHPWRSEH